MPTAGRSRKRMTPPAQAHVLRLRSWANRGRFVGLGRSLSTAFFGWAMVCGCMFLCGCAEGPLYSTGWLSPYAIEHWKNEEKYGPTIHTLRDEQVRLRETWSSLSPAERESALADLALKFETTTNQTLKLEYLKTVGAAAEPSAIPTLVKATGDRSVLVRSAACDALKGRESPEAQGRLRDLAESDSSIDVRLAAIRALEGDSSEGTFGTLGRLLEDDDPAVQYRTMATLETTTGREYGRDRRAWSAYLAGEEPEIRQAGWFEGWVPFY